MTNLIDSTTEFADQVALITGGGSGIGQAIAQRWAAGGGIAAVLGRRESALAETVDLIESAGGRAIALPSCDIRDHEAVAASIQALIDQTGRLDALVNNAAGNFVVPGEALSPRGWKSVIDIVLNGSFHATSAAGRHMLAAGSGAILNVIATYAWHGHPGTVHSAAAKAGVVAMTRTLAVEWAARGVRINCIAPGPTETAGAGAALWPDDQARSHVLSSVPTQRFATPEEIAESAVYLLSSRASYITGEVLVADGGQWLGKAIYTDPGQARG
ncbi:2,4-dienoyl-CoA reductase [Mycobacterium sp. CBMA 234]|uniref:SDR family oxidoreductase n=1 Tax=Mycolicibacterium sp. CBMA 234 TaxID=1918495 RepID=UPI0012DF7C36|nr:SDR family oxidoreductase [Mycolicibacterium sp. CBMA 234]MUL68215.1 2,4-dienoyl-CoA reductase [Mycolicibacterium sp. CBMA 234]